MTYLQEEGLHLLGTSESAVVGTQAQQSCTTGLDTIAYSLSFTPNMTVVAT